MFLKKLHYLIENKEITNRDGDPNSTLINAIFAFDCLRGLKYNRDEHYANFKNYLELVRQWRNDEAHLAPNSTVEELIAATHIIVTMYVFVVSQHTTDLDMAGYNMDKQDETVENIRPYGEKVEKVFPMAAEEAPYGDNNN